MKSGKTIIKQYDKVILKTGEEATIIEIYEEGVVYEADIRDGDDYRTELINQDEILSLESGPESTLTRKLNKCSILET